MSNNLLALFVLFYLILIVPYAFIMILFGSQVPSSFNTSQLYLLINAEYHEQIAIQIKTLINYVVALALLLHSKRCFMCVCSFFNFFCLTFLFDNFFLLFYFIFLLFYFYFHLFSFFFKI